MMTDTKEMLDAAMLDFQNARAEIIVQNEQIRILQEKVRRYELALKEISDWYIHAPKEKKDLHGSMSRAEEALEDEK